MTLPERAVISPERRRAIDAFREDTADHPPSDLADRIRDRLGIDLSTTFAGFHVPHPFGKASGQLSCQVSQVREDVRAGLAFVVLKTVIAEDAGRERSMAEWATNHPRMRVERRRARDGRDGWTVTWNGRGWSGTLDTYLAFCREALAEGRAAGVPVVPSVKLHLPSGREPFRRPEYEHTIRSLERVWHDAGCPDPLVVEKDFSPTLAADARSERFDDVLRWVREVPGEIARAARGAPRVGVKLMNALVDAAAQSRLLDAAQGAAPAPAFLVLFNRLFDVDRRVAYGGWDLSARNLGVLRAGRSRVPWVGTGNICTGRVMLDYAMAGCTAGQVHTLFQVPRREYTARNGSRSACALHTLLLHPDHGLVPWLVHLYETDRVDQVDHVIRFADILGRG